MKIPQNNPLYFYPFLSFFVCVLLISCSQHRTQNDTVPDGIKLFDDRLSLILMAEDPDIVTPIGIAVDGRDRVFVLESHTHLPPKDYKGPDTDLIKVFWDSNDDGKLDSMEIFADGIMEGLNMAFSPEGHLYVVTSKEVWAFYDKDGDGISEASEKLLGLTEPENVYPHAALLSITFSADGWMYIGRGNTGGVAWRFEGTDGSSVSGYGDGGNIMRARWDGSQLEEFATGFWNPFDLKFDNEGRLLVADNDPDSRGPNRLVHAVQYGDYGYKSLFGGSGIHPYLAWDGELPGTLPYSVALGEAPSGLLNTSLANLPLDYENQMLCTIWEESTIVRIRMQEDGTSISGDTEVILEGGDDFRPVAFATDSKGTIYFTDWVLRYYPNHGRGKIWKLSAREGVEGLERKPMFKTPELQLTSKVEFDFSSLLEDLRADDPFVVHAAIVVLAEGDFTENLLAFVDDKDPAIRLGVLLALQKSGKKAVEPVTKTFLSDPDPRIRNSALIWIGSSQITERRRDLEMALTSGETTTALFETYLETVKLLQPDFVKAYQSRKEKNSKSLKRQLPENFVASIVSDPAKSVAVRVFALRYLDNLDGHREQLLSFLKNEKEQEIQLEIIRTIKNIMDDQVRDELIQIAMDKNHPNRLRAEAVWALSNQKVDNVEVILPLLDDEEDVAKETARFLRSRIGDERVKSVFEKKIKEETSGPLKQQFELGLTQELANRPDIRDEEAWQTLLSGSGEIDRGRRVFFSNTSLCSTCHAVDGRGGDLGPDLSNVGKSKDRNQLISSILYPSAEISPEWQGWYIQLNDGTLYHGRQIDVGNNDIVLYTQAEGFISLDKVDIADYGMVKESLMPEGLESRLSDQDLRDLLAYLQMK